MFATSVASMVMSTIRMRGFLSRTYVERELDPKVCEGSEHSNMGCRIKLSQSAAGSIRGKSGRWLDIEDSAATVGSDETN